MNNHDPHSDVHPGAISAPTSQGPSARPTRAVVCALCLLSIWSASPGEISGQEASPEELSLAVGIGRTTGGLSWQIAASQYHSETRVVGLRLLGSVAILGEGSAYDLAIHFGLRRPAEGVWLAVAVGPSVTWAGDRECLQSSGGIFGCERRGRVERDFGGGVSAQATLGGRRASVAVVGGVTTIASYGGLIVSLHLGRLP